MKGNPKIHKLLNEVLKAELTAINQYFVHAKMCQNWGYDRLFEKVYAESIDEMKHADKLVDRILFLEGTPNMTDYFKINIGDDVKKQLENDLALEESAIPRLNVGVQTCLEEGDGGTRELLEHILVDEEEHADWLEIQLRLIKEIGIEAYLAEQMKK
ncbi:MAG: bacterioferritin [Acidobacteriia bacterium]|nr:bacterioferritin [Terriglobia bacterium]